MRKSKAEKTCDPYCALQEILREILQLTGRSSKDYFILYLRTAEHTFFSSLHGIFTS